MSPQSAVRNAAPTLSEVFRKLAEQKECRIEEGHLLADHVHMMISIPPKYSVSQVIGFIKVKSAIGSVQSLSHFRSFVGLRKVVGLRLVYRSPSREAAMWSGQIRFGCYPMPG